MTGDLHGLPWCQRGIGLGENSIPSRLQLCDLFRIALGFGAAFQGIYLFFDLCDRFFEVECHHFRCKSPVLTGFYREGFGFVESMVDVIPLIEEPERMNTTNEMKKLGFLGCGNMGGAILEGILEHGELDRDDILVVEKSSERMAFWSERGVSVTESAEALTDVSGIMLGVKPQSFDQAAEDLGTLRRSCMVVSIMAGIDSQRISRKLGPEARVVRVMPNTPCSIGMGISAISKGAHATDSDMETTTRIMSTVGGVVEVDEESMHVVTATSGSGPPTCFSWPNPGLKRQLPMGCHETSQKCW